MLAVTAVLITALVYLQVSSAPLEEGLLQKDDRTLLDSIFHDHHLLSHDSSILLTTHKGLKRRSLSSQPAAYIRWTFYALQRNFTLQITPHPEIFSNDLSIETDKQSFEVDRNKAYLGHITDDDGSQIEQSHVAGVLLEDGRFEGKIVDRGAEYFIERAEKYFLPSNTSIQLLSIIYRGSDVKTDDLHRRSQTCAFDQLLRKTRSLLNETRARKNKVANKGNEMYIKERNRKRRAIDSEKTTCELYLQADHHYYEKWGSVDTVVELLTAYVQAVNSIYKTTDFDGDSQPDNVTFAIKKVKIWTDQKSPGYPFADNLDIYNFLEIFAAQESFDSFCLAYTFTHRDFNDGTLGLAWPGSIDGSGGVCSKYTVYGNDPTPKSLNTGVVTTLNFQRDVIFSVSQLTFAHELGHNLGALHDDETNKECAPGDSGGGNFIMYPKATDGDKLNNNKFSACSISSMNEVMNEHARHEGAEACFTAYSEATCGNKVVETGEDCDCGWDDECDEACCHPQRSNYDSVLYTPCTYTNSSVCSPSEGSCCGSDCKPREASEQYECRTNTTCTEAAVCAGAAHCPASEAKTNGIDCADGMVCYAGDCSTSICQAFNYEQCQCTPLTEGNWNDERLCQLCCAYEGVCTLSEAIPNITRSTAGITGQPCFEYQGYCDVFLKCRQLDPVGTINGLRRLFATDEGQVTVTEWVTANWYIVAAAILGFVILLALAVKFGAKHDPVVPIAKNKVAQK